MAPTLALSVSGVFYVVGGESDIVVSRYEATFPATALFLRDDSNNDGAVDISDAIRIFMYLFQRYSEPSCLKAGDSNDDGFLDMSDGIIILLDLGRPGTSLPPPGPATCGVDSTPDDLTCLDAPDCR